eukprot:4991744-Pyramimonas_sp.AAC.1
MAWATTPNGTCAAEMRSLPTAITLVRGVVDGLWRDRFLKEEEDHGCQSFPRWKHYEELAAPDEAWHHLKYLEEDQNYRLARQQQREL